MIKQYIGLAFLAVKNIFVKGGLRGGLLKLLIIIGLPLFIAYLTANSYKTWEDIKGNGVWIISWQLGLFLVYWLRELLQLAIKNNVKIVESKSIERIYLYASFFLFIWFLLFLPSPSLFTGHLGIGIIKLVFYLSCLLFVVWGMALIAQTRERKTMSWIIIVATLMAISYPFLIRH